MNITDEDGIHSLLETAKTTEYYAIYYLLLFSGMRRSEALGLRWSDVNLDMCELSVNHSMHHIADGTTVFRQPKKSRSHRLISLTPSTAFVLKEHKEKQTAERLLAGSTLANDGLVFCQPDGSPILPDTVIR
jgi:integrase